MFNDFALGLVAVGPILPDSLQPRNPCRVRDAPPLTATHTPTDVSGAYCSIMIIAATGVMITRLTNSTD